MRVAQVVGTTHNACHGRRVDELVCFLTVMVVTHKHMFIQHTVVGAWIKGPCDGYHKIEDGYKNIDICLPPFIVPGRNWSKFLRVPIEQPQSFLFFALLAQRHSNYAYASRPNWPSLARVRARLAEEGRNGDRGCGRRGHSSPEFVKRLIGHHDIEAAQGVFELAFGNCGAPGVLSLVLQRLLFSKSKYDDMFSQTC